MASSLVLNRSPKVPAQETAAFGAIAERFRRAGALDKAVSLCQEGLKKFPDHVSARVTLGWSLLDLGKYEEARLELEQVLRRAPDNLAAIRGLAELHDRFEHTLNLPMDGPGQWPPSAADVEDLADAPIVAKAAPESVATASAADDVPAVMVPADMGMPIWSPVAVAPDTAPVTQVPPAARAESMTMSAAPATSAAAGMSSVREIDFPSSATTEAPGVSAPVDAEVDLAALIAEAESLEAAAEAAVVMAPEVEAGLDSAPTVELLADLDLSADQDLAAQLQLGDDLGLVTSPVAESDLPVTIELAATDEASELDVLAVATAPDSADTAPVIGSDAAVEATALVEQEVVIEAPAAVEAEVAIEGSAVFEPEVAVEAAAPVVSEAVPEESVQVEETQPEPAGVSSVAPEVTAEADYLESMAEPVAALEAVDEPEFANVLAFVPAAEAAVSGATRTAHANAALPALERMLRQVQARRQQLMAESVA